MTTRWLRMLALCTLTAGCQLANNAVHNLTYEAKVTTAEVQEHCHYEKLARESWATLACDENHGEFTKDFADGFKDGFVDYLQFGGPGHPPYVPPQRYWGPHYRTPEGYARVQEWYSGFRLGTATAQQSGYRQWATLPSARTSEWPAVGPVLEGLVTPELTQEHKPEPARRFPTAAILEPSVTTTPLDGANLAAARKPDDALIVLGAPILSLAALGNIQFPEPARPASVIGHVPDAAQMAPFTIEVVETNRPFGIPVAERSQVVIFPPVQASFGFPVGAAGWIEDE